MNYGAKISKKPFSCDKMIFFSLMIKLFILFYVIEIVATKTIITKLDIKL